MQDAFHSEVAILKACRNKNIVGYLGDYVDDERTWIIMEYMEVQTIIDTAFAKQSRCQLPPNERCFMSNHWLRPVLHVYAGWGSVQSIEERQGRGSAVEQEVRCRCWRLLLGTSITLQ